MGGRAGGCVAGRREDNRVGNGEAWQGGVHAGSVRHSTKQASKREEENRGYTGV